MSTEPVRSTGSVGRLVAAVIVVMVALLVGVAIGRSQVDPALESISEPPGSEPLPVIGPSASAASAGPTASPVAAPDPQVPQPVEVRQAVAEVNLTVPSDLDDTPTVADGYRFSDQGIQRRSFAQLLARKFGVGGEPKVTPVGGWVVGTDGGPQVRIEPGSMVLWTYQGGDGSDGVPGPAVESVAVATPSADPSRLPGTADPERAKAVTRAFLGDLGVPLDQVDWQVEVTPEATTVTAWQVIADQRIDLSWTVTLAPTGEIVAASGFGATPVEIPGYEVIGAASAVVRARRPGWSALGPTPLEPGTQALAPVGGDHVAPDDRPMAVIEVANLDVVSADLGLAQFRQPDGALLILPSYRLTASDGSVWSVVAISDDYVRLVDPYADSNAATTR